MGKRYALELDETLHAGWVRAPGDGYFDVNPWLRDKQGALLVEPEPLFWEWVEGSLYDERRDAAIVAFDEEGREVERLVLGGARVVELGLPSVDPDGVGALWLQVEAKTAEMQGGAATAEARGEPPAIIGCRVHLHGPAPQPVHEIDALTITLGRRGLQRVKLAVEGDADWEAAESLVDREGALEYLAAETGPVLARVEFKIAGIDVERVEASAEGSQRAKLVLACRSLRLGPTGGGESS
jgi:hypothetical protein